MADADHVTGCKYNNTDIFPFLPGMAYPSMFIASFGVVGIFYITVYYFIKNYQKHLGTLRQNANLERFKVGDAIFKLSAELFVNNKTESALRLFDIPNQKLSYATSKFLTISQVPRIGIELLLFILVLSFIKFIDIDTLEKNLPELIAFLFAGYKSMPYFQGIYNSLSSIKYSSASEQNIERLLRNKTIVILDDKTSKPNLPVFIAAETKSSNSDIKIDIPISSGSITHLCGPSGVGKSVLIESIVGINGSFNVEVNDEQGDAIHLNDFRALIAYASQGSALFEATVRQNIAWMETVHDKSVESLMAIVDLPSKFIDQDIKYLSGGQKQRVIIARSLYLNKKILILDEPFVGLDSVATEQLVISIIREFPHTALLLCHHGKFKNREFVREVYLSDCFF